MGARRQKMAISIFLGTLFSDTLKNDALMRENEGQGRARQQSTYPVIIQCTMFSVLKPHIGRLWPQLIARSHKAHISKVPDQPTWKSFSAEDLPIETEIDHSLISHLERLALVDFGNQEGIDRLSAAVRFADQLTFVDTSNVEPLYSVLENRSLHLREDNITEGSCKKDILVNAKNTEEEYFVAPPGNIALTSRTTYSKDPRSEGGGV